MHRAIEAAGIAVRTVFVFLFVFCWTTLLFAILVGPIAVAERLCGRRRADFGALVLGRCIRWSSVFVRAVTRVVLDRRHAAPEGTVVVVCNHHSIVDLYWLFHLYPRLFYIARRSLFTVPIIGWGAALLGQIPLSGDGWAALEEARTVLQDGRTVALFPEGTRYPEGEMGPFRRGAFRLAQETTELVQPVVVAGTWRVLPRGRWGFRTLGPMGMRVLPPERVPGDLSREELDRRIAEIREIMIRERQRLAEEIGLPGATRGDGGGASPGGSRT